MNRNLSDFVKVKQRYVRSINLERDLDDIDSIKGYIPTSRSIEALNRFFRAFNKPNTVRAWTITSVYGTGKSAFANFLTSLCAEISSQARKEAEQVIESVGVYQQDNWLAFQNNYPEKGLLRAVTVAQREPISNTIVRALYNGAVKYWHKGKKPEIFYQIERLYQDSADHAKVDAAQTLNVLKEVASKTQGGLLLVIDELGKNLEYITEHQSEADLFLLQQIAELPSGKNDPKVLVIGLLHQSFAGYTSRLNAIQRNEWTKIQGRFEDVSFTESTEQIVNLISQAIEHNSENELNKQISQWEQNWIEELNNHAVYIKWNKGQLNKIYPLHPLTAQVLPTLCQKFAQNDRSLFTFLAGTEPYSLPSFLSIHSINTDFGGSPLSCLKLHELYDYFIESVGITSQPRYTRWIEIHSRILEASNLSSDENKVLKTIGILNLINNPKASLATIVLCLCSDPSELNEKTHWEKIIKDLIRQGFITWRERIDEIRIWEGSDFNIEDAIKLEIEKLGNTSFAQILNKIYPLAPIIAHRHSYQSGTLRYFECQYADNTSDLNNITCSDSTCDGKILYWVDTYNVIKNIPSLTQDDKPVVLIASESIEAFHQALLDYVALKRIEAGTTQLSTDGVARKEVKQRLISSKHLLDQLFQRSFSLTSPFVYCWIDAKQQSYQSESVFNKALSERLDLHYHKGPRYWNELINRRKLSSNAVKARRELMTAMLQHEDKEKLGLKGYGPEVSIYQSLLVNTGIHIEVEDQWKLTDPKSNCGINEVWSQIEEFLTSATDATKSIDELFDILKAAPYGVKEGPLPVLVTALLIKHADDIGLYYNDKYLPTIEPEHLDFLTRFPERFAVKYFKIEGIQAEFFKAIEEIFDSKSIANIKLRNSTLLGLVSPLIKFIKALPQYTLQTKELSHEALAIRESILKMTEPDQLLFIDLPAACGYSDIREQANDKKEIKAFKARLIQALLELQNAFPHMLSNCKGHLYDAFGVVGGKQSIRENLRVRANHLYGKVIEKKISGFVSVAVDKKSNEQQWLESVIMTIADKPARFWRDEDLIKFEMKVADFSRRFKNLEAMQSELVATQLIGFDALRLSLTSPDGHEINKMVWVNHSDKEKLKQSLEKYISELGVEKDIELQKAYIATWIKKLYDEEERAREESEIIKRKKSG